MAVVLVVEVVMVIALVGVVLVALAHIYAGAKFCNLYILCGGSGGGGGGCTGVWIFAAPIRILGAFPVRFHPSIL